MTHRITVPDDHVALILPSQLADELMSLLKQQRRFALAVIETNAYSENKEFRPRAKQTAEVTDKVLFALLEAKEA